MQVLKDSTTVPMILVGNKIDLKDDRKVSPEEARAFAASLKAGYMEISVKGNINGTLPFDEIVRRIRVRQRADAAAAAQPPMSIPVSVGGPTGVAGPHHTHHSNEGCGRLTFPANFYAFSDHDVQTPGHVCVPVQLAVGRLCFAYCKGLAVRAFSWRAEHCALHCVFAFLDRRHHHRRRDQGDHAKVFHLCRGPHRVDLLPCCYHLLHGSRLQVRTLGAPY